MLATLDRQLRLWHVWAANVIAVAWFGSMALTIQRALPDTGMFRCPIGFCANGYYPDDLREVLASIGPEGRMFLQHTLRPLDMVLPALLLIALVIDYVWLTRPGERVSVPLSPAARWALLAVPILYCLADYGENWAVSNLIKAYPNIDDRLALRASLLTAAKSQLVAASIGFAIALAIAARGFAQRR
jgi:hypothetical protein